jgi:hypothetical protein
MDQEDDPAVEKLRQQAEAVGKWLRQTDVPYADFDEQRDSEHLRDIDSLFDSMSALVEGVANEGI